jgi:hypothetical protein
MPSLRIVEQEEAEGPQLAVRILSSVINLQPLSLNMARVTAYSVYLSNPSSYTYSVLTTFHSRSCLARLDFTFSCSPHFALP